MHGIHFLNQTQQWNMLVQINCNKFTNLSNGARGVNKAVGELLDRE